MSRRVWWSSAALLIALGVWGCTPEGGGGDDDDDGGGAGGAGGGMLGGFDAEGPVTLDMRGPDASADMGAGGEGGMGGEGGVGGEGGEGGMGGMGGEGGEGGAVMMECVPGETRCPDEGAPVREICRIEGIWAIQACADGNICFGGDCVRDPAGCADGERICLADGRPAECDGGQWLPQAMCPAGLVCGAGDCLNPQCAAAARQSSYQGCEYLAADLPNSTLSQDGEGLTPSAPWGIVIANVSADSEAAVSIFDAGGQPMPLVASTRIAVPAEAAFGTMAATVQSEVRDADGMIVEQQMNRADLVVVPPGGLATFLLPRRMGPVNTTSIGSSAVRVVTDSPVVAYQFSPYCCNYSFSNDASLLVPVRALGNRYRWLGVPMMTLPFQSNAVVTVIGAEDGTDVRLTLPAGVNAAADAGGRVRQVGQTVDVQLDAQDVLLLHSAAPAFGGSPPDFSGTLVESSKPVALFSTHVCTNYPSALAACDHLQEQIIPIDTWGNGFQLVPTKLRAPAAFNEYTYWKLMAGDEAATITFSVPFADLRAAAPGFAGVTACSSLVQGGNTLTLQPGQVCEFGSKSAVEIAATSPILVMGIISGQQSTGLGNGAHAGDPAIFLLPPARQYRRDYTFLTPGTYFSDYVTVITPPNNDLVLDGVPVDLADAERIPGSGVAYKHLSLQDGAHTLVGRAAFGIVVYAYDDYVSYAFTGGLNLSK